MATLSKGMVGLLGEIASLLHGAVASGLKLVTNLLTSGFKMAFQFNDAAMAFSRQAGLSAKQAQAYTEVLTKRAKDLGEKYGIAAEEVAKIEKNLAKATGRVIMLSNAQADMQIAINRTVGEQAADEFSQMMMRTMGASVTTVQGAVSKAYATAAKRGLDASNFAAKVSQNLGMANRLTFRNGVDGLIKMVSLSEKLGFNVQTIEQAANSFMDLQDAIENSAKLTMLGGAAGALGGNPLNMAYEANADPEAFAERLTKMAGGYAQFDAKTGMAKLNYMSRDMLKGMADAMHISLDEMVGIAKKQAEVTYKNNMFGADLDRLSGGDEAKRDFLLNKSQYDPNANGGRGGLVMTDRTGQAQELDYFFKEENKDELAEMMRFNGMTDEQIVREQAEAVVSIRERLEGYFTTIQALFAEKIAPYIPKMQAFLGDIYRIVKPHFAEIADNLKNLMASFFTKENIDKVKSGITTVASAVMGIAKLLTSNWKWLIGGMLIGPILGVLTWIATQVTLMNARNGVRGVGGRPGVGAGAGGSNFSRLYNVNRTRYGNGVIRSGWNSLYGRTGQYGNAPGLKGLGIGLAAGIGGTVMKSYSDEEGVKRGNKTDTWLSNGGSMLQGAGTGLGIASMIAPFTGPFAGLVMATGALAGGAIGYFSQASANEKKRTEYEKDTNERIIQMLGGNNDNTLKLPGSETHATGLYSGAIGGEQSSTNDEFISSLQKVIEGKNKGVMVHKNEVVVNEEQQRVINENLGNSSVTHITVTKQPFINSIGNGAVSSNSITNNTPVYNIEKVKQGAIVGGMIPGLGIVGSVIGGGIGMMKNNVKETSIQPLPVGGKEYIYTPENNASQNVGDNKISVNDINVKFSGTIRLDGGSSHKDYDINELVNNKDFVKALMSRPEMMDAIRSALSANGNMKEMRDTAFMTGFQSSTNTGRMKNGFG